MEPGLRSDKHLIVGTAGHVDHGKTLLIGALTGKNTDRLKEEKERGISIELGFAPLELPSGRLAGVVDVPGHERFIKQMLAGAGGMDLVLLVIAADEGIMPQTREHMDILQLLQVTKVIVVLTKADLVDEEWLQLVEEEVKEVLQDTPWAGAPVLPVSSVTGRGLEELKEIIDQVVAQIPGKLAAGQVRMPIDRIFSITGFGTVVTGTLFSGTLRLGDMLEIRPEEIPVRVRGLQVHGQKVETAYAGQRVAVNLSGVEVGDLERGSVLLSPRYLANSHRVDVSLELLPEVEKPLTNRERVRFYLGSKETLGRVILLDREELEPGDKALAQIQMEEPVVAARHDRFVIRTYSPMVTVGGGSVIDPQAPRHRRFGPEVLSALAAKQQGSTDELILQRLLSQPTVHGLQDLAAALNLTPQEAGEGVEVLKAKELALGLEGDKEDLVVSAGVFRGWQEEVSRLLSDFHAKYPLRKGFPKEELRSRRFSSLTSKVFNQLLKTLESRGTLEVQGQGVALPGWRPQPSPRQAKILEELLRRYREDACQPQPWEERAKAAGLTGAEGEEVLLYLLDSGALVKIAEDIYFAQEAVQEAIDKITAHIKEKGEILVSEARDLLGSSRRFLVPLMEYLDREKVTRRIGDKRVLF